MKFKSKNDADFFTSLGKRVNDYLETKNGNRFGSLVTHAKSLFLVFLYISIYIILLTCKLNMVLSILLVAIMGLTAVMNVFNTVHDASHNVLFKNPTWNRIAAYLGDLIGMNSYIWNIRHNIQHHTFTNVVGGDVLLDSIPFIRVCPQQKKLAMHKYQSRYVVLMYMLYSVFWIFFIDFNMFRKKQMGNFKDLRHPWQEWLKLLLFKSFYIFYMFVIPVWFAGIPLSIVITGFFIYHIAAGILLSTVVVLGHCVEGAAYTAPDDNGIIQSSWMQHEWDSTYDCNTNTKWFHWITGGLNTHIAHHLFPKFCYRHYHAITKIIKQHCAEYGISYPHYNLSQAIVSHFKFLRIQANAPDLSK